MFRLAHISDVHLTPLPKLNRYEWASKRITGYINWKRNRTNQLRSEILAHLIADLKIQMPDHIAITGDLVNLALKDEIKKATDWLHTLGEPMNISLVPGNHDAYVPGALAKAWQQWKPFMPAPGGNSPNKPLFPYVRDHGLMRVIGCSSAQATMPFISMGYFRKVQADRLREQLLSAKKCHCFRIVLIHHPPFSEAGSWHKRLAGAGLFRKVIMECGAELILHGHTHMDSFRYIPGPIRGVPVIGVPAASQAVGGKCPPARYNLFEIEQIHDHWSTTMIERGYCDNGSLVEINKRKIF